MNYISFQGFLRVFEDMPDIILDVPLAGTVLERFVDQCHKAGFITDEMVKRMPMRFVKCIFVIYIYICLIFNHFNDYH